MNQYPSQNSRPPLQEGGARQRWGEESPQEQSGYGLDRDYEPEQRQRFGPHHEPWDRPWMASRDAPQRGGDWQQERDWYGEHGRPAQGRNWRQGQDWQQQGQNWQHGRGYGGADPGRRDAPQSAYPDDYRGRGPNHAEDAARRWPRNEDRENYGALQPGYRGGVYERRYGEAGYREPDYRPGAQRDDRGSQDYRRHQGDRRAHPGAYAEQRYAGRPELQRGVQYGAEQYRPQHFSGGGNWAPSAAQGYAARADYRRPPQPARGAYRGRGPKGYTRSDERIREDICERLSEDPGVDASDVSVSVQAGIVTLEGGVGSRAQKRRAEDIADACSGVRDIHNRLAVPMKDAARTDRGGGAAAGAKAAEVKKDDSAPDHL